MGTENISAFVEIPCSATLCLCSEKDVVDGQRNVNELSLAVVTRSGKRTHTLPMNLSGMALLLKSMEPIHHVFVRLCLQVLVDTFLTNDRTTLACHTW